MTVRTQRRSRTMSSTTVATSRRPLTMRARHLALLVEFAYADLTATATERWARELPNPTVEQPRGCAFQWADPSRRHTRGPPCAAAHARDETRWPRPDVRQPRGESAGAGGGCASCGLNGVREAGRANGLCRVAQRILDRGVGDPRGRWPSACPMSQAGVLSCLRENTASAVLFTEVLANHALAALVCGAPTGSAAPSPGGLSGAGQDGLSTREGRRTHAARTTAVNRGEGVTELTWCSGQSVRAAQVRRPAAKASISCSCSSTEAWRIMPECERNLVGN